MGSDEVAIHLLANFHEVIVEDSRLDSSIAQTLPAFAPNIGIGISRPEWLGPFNFFLFPIISEKLGGYPAGFDKSNFLFITPMESDRGKWPTLVGVNLFDRQTYQISMSPNETQDKVVPDSVSNHPESVPEKGRSEVSRP